MGEEVNNTQVRSGSRRESQEAPKCHQQPAVKISNVVLILALVAAGGAVFHSWRTLQHARFVGSLPDSILTGPRIAGPDGRSGTGGPSQSPGDAKENRNIEDWYHSATARTPGSGSTTAVTDGEKHRRTAAHIAAFIETGDARELRAIPPKDARQFAQFIAKRFGRDEVVKFAKEFGSMPDYVIPYDEAQLTEFTLGWFHALRGDSARQEVVQPVVEKAPVDIAFTATMTGPAGSATSFPSAAGSIFGVFENRGRVAGLAQVVAVWRDLSTDHVKFQECEPVHPNSAFNYVWLGLPDGWPAGRCQLELFDPKDAFRRLGGGEFTIE